MEGKSNAERPLRTADGAISRRIGDELVMHLPSAASSHALNSTAATVYELISEGTPVASIADSLAVRLDLDDGTDLVDAALHELATAGLVESADRSLPSRRSLLIGGAATAAMLPVVTSIVAPTPAAAQSDNGGGGGGGNIWGVEADLRVYLFIDPRPGYPYTLKPEWSFYFDDVTGSPPINGGQGLIQDTRTYGGGSYSYAASSGFNWYQNGMPFGAYSMYDATISAPGGLGVNKSVSFTFTFTTTQAYPNGKFVPGGFTATVLLADEGGYFSGTAHVSW